MANVCAWMTLSNATAMGSLTPYPVSVTGTEAKGTPVAGDVNRAITV